MSIPSSDRERATTLPTGSRPARELAELRVGSAASIAELREFLTQLKGRKPQEVIGIVSASLLVQSMIMALVIVLGIMVVFTVGPYVVYGPPQPKKSATPSTIANGPSEPTALPGNTDTASKTAQGDSANNASATSTSPNEPDIKRGSEAMGIDEAKQADPAKNPLDSPDLDKLLDGLDP